MQKDLFNNDYMDIYLTEGREGQPVICYRTGMTVYEEMYDKGRLVSAGWNNSGTPLNVLEGMPYRLDFDAFTEPWAFEVEVNGECLSYNWEYAGFEKKEEYIEPTDAHTLHGIITLKNSIYPLTVQVHTVLSGSAIFTRYITLINNSDLPMKINKFIPMSGGMEILYDWDQFVDSEKDKFKVFSIGYMDTDKGCAEGAFRWHDMQSCGTSIYGRYRNDRFRYPMFMIRNNALGHIYFGQMAWSGGFEFNFDMDADQRTNGIDIRGDRADAKLDFKLRLAGPAPLLVLEPGEVFKSPEIYIGRVHGDLDDAVNMMHKHTRKVVFTFDEPKENIATVGAGIGPERAMTQEAIFHTMDTAILVGAESCIIDAGWNCEAGREGPDWWNKVGDWTPDPEKHGDNFAAIRNRCHENGLKFGMWMEVERISKTTKIAEAHPEWFQTRYLQGTDSQVIDMTNPEAPAWVKSQIEKLINEYGIDLFRLDFNVGYEVSICKNDRGSVAECNYLRYYTALYNMFASLREKYPHVIFENCASGGGRADLGMVRNFTHSWVSDYQIMPKGYMITNGMTMVIPPERVDRLVSGMNGHLRGSLDMTVRQTLMAKPTTNTYNPMGSAMNPQEIEFVRHSFEIYKNFIRPYMTDGYIYHHTPECHDRQPKGRGIIERTSLDGTKGVIGIFNLVNVLDELITVYPKGLDESKTYEVTFDNKRTTAVVDGFTLINDGIRVRLPGSLTSELILYSAI